jgi:peptidoglycan/LPS O-acetylase OafA/YrhL
MLIPMSKGIGNRTLSYGTSWLRALGRWSYEIYLFHMLPLIGLMVWFRQSERPTYVFLFTYIAMLLGSVVLGALIFGFSLSPSIGN